MTVGHVVEEVEWGDSRHLRESFLQVANETLVADDAFSFAGLLPMKHVHVTFEQFDMSLMVSWLEPEQVSKQEAPLRKHGVRVQRHLDHIVKCVGQTADVTKPV